MTGSEVFRSVFLGGYHKADVDEYIQTVERQIESVKAAHQKEQNDLIQKYEERLLEKTALLENAERKLLVTERELSSAGERLLVTEEKLSAAEADLGKRSADFKEKVQEAPDGAKEEEKLRQERERLLAELEAARGRAKRAESELEEMVKKQEEDLLDRQTIKKVLEEASLNADMIREEAQRAARGIVEEAVSRGEEQKKYLARQIESLFEEKGIQLIAVKHQIIKYMKEVDQTLQGLHNIYCRMDRMVENMPLKIEDYWAGDPYEIPEEPDGERTKNGERANDGKRTKDGDEA